MNKFLVLVVEDDPIIRNLITTSLDINDYKYVVASDGRTALMLATSNKPDIVLLDLGLPDMDGTEVIEKIRGWSKLPIIVISARCEDQDKVKALDAGADDYLVKPFSVDELMARIRVATRRIPLLNNAENDHFFENGKLRIDCISLIVTYDGEELHLTPSEFKLLCLLAKNLGKVLTHTYITKEIWGGSTESDVVTLRVFMTSLRKKVDPSSEMIQTHVGIGYRMVRL